MKYICSLIIYILGFNLCYGGFTVTILNMKYSNNTVIPSGSPINLSSSGTKTIKFDVRIDSNNELNSNETFGTLRVITKSGNVIQTYVTLSQQLIPTYSNPPWTQTQNIQITLASSDYNLSGDYLYAEFEDNNYSKWASANWPITKNAVYPPVSNNTICCDQIINIGQSAATIIGSTPTGGSGTYTYQWHSAPFDAFGDNTPISGATSQNYSPGYVTESTYFSRFVLSNGTLYTSPWLLIEVNDCPVSNTITKAVSSSTSQERQASSYLILQNILQANSSALYHGADYVVIKNGFWSKQDSNTFIYIAGCNPERRGNWDEVPDNEEIMVSDIIVFPNPAKDNITIVSATVIKSVSVTSLEGKVIFNKNIPENLLQYQLDINGLSNGIYIIQITDVDGRQQTTKMVKN